MTKSDEVMTTTNDDDAIGFGTTVKNVGIPMLSFAAGLMFLLGGIGAAALFFAKNQIVSVGMTLSVAAGVIGMFIVIATFRKWPTLNQGDPITPRTRRYSWAMIALIAFAALVSTLFIQPAEGSISTELYSNGPLPAPFALAAAALWVAGMPLLSAITRRNMDEVEKGHLIFGESVGFRFLSVAAPAWWLGYRGGFLPQPDVMLLFVAVLAAASIANLTRRIA